MFPSVDKCSINKEKKQINSTSGQPVSVLSTSFMSMKSTIYEYIIFIIRLVMKG